MLPMYNILAEKPTLVVSCSSHIRNSCTPYRMKTRTLVKNSVD